MPREADDQQRELLQAAVGGDRVAMERLLLTHYSRLERHVAAQLPESAQAVISPEDILQEAFVQAFRDIEQFDLNGAVSLGAWLRAIVDHRLTDALRKLRTIKRGAGMRRVQNDAARSSLGEFTEQLMGDDERPSQMMARAEALQAVQVRLAGLPDDQQEAIRLRYLNQQSLESVAVAMQKSPAAVRGLVHRAKTSLREMLGRTSRWWSIKN